MCWTVQSLTGHCSVKLYCIMSELTDFEGGQIVGTRMVGASINNVAEIFSVARGTVSKIYSAYLKYG